MFVKVGLLILTTFVAFSNAVAASSANGVYASENSPSQAWLFSDDNWSIPFRGVSRYPWIESANWYNQDVTEWLRSYFMTHSVNGQLSGVIPFRATFGPQR
jgi:hypothetical protein